MNPAPNPTEYVQISAMSDHSPPDRPGDSLGSAGESQEPSIDSPFLSGLAAGERQQIWDKARRLAISLRNWASQYPMIRQERALPLSLSVCAAAPFCDMAALEATAHVSLFVFALDDFFDESGRSAEALAEIGEQLCRIAAGESLPGYSTDQMAQALIEIRMEMAHYPLYKALRAQWESAVCGTVKGMVQESRWRQAFQQDGALPSWEAYLEWGRYSIGGPPHIWSALVTIGDPSTPRHLERLEQLEALSSTCIRLANDLRSYPKELAERNVNSLHILSRQAAARIGGGAPPLREAERRVRQEIAARLAELRRLQNPSITETGQPEAAIVDIARFVSEFYARYDFHTFSSGRP